MPIDHDLAESLNQFRKDIINALAEIDVEINALQLAIQEQSLPLTLDRLKQIRNDSRANTLHKFWDFHSNHICSPGDPQAKK
jgi:hypothetical protein